jgi:hypothetical protein
MTFTVVGEADGKVSVDTVGTGESAKSTKMVWYLADGIYSMHGDLAPARQVGDDETAVLGTSRPEVAFPGAWRRGEDRLVWDELVPRESLEESAHHLHLAGGGQAFRDRGYKFSSLLTIRDLGIEAHVILSDGAHYPATGKVDFAANRVDPSTGTIQVRIVFANERKALTPGMFVRVLVSSDKPYEAILVPERAIGTDQSDKFVYVVDEKNIAQRRNVVLGTKHGRLRAIKEGVGPNDRVIISGALLVRPGDPVEVIGDEKIKDDLPPIEMTQLKPVVNAAPAVPAPPITKRVPAGER